MKEGKPLLIGFSAFTAIGIMVYWSFVFFGVFPVTELVPGYITWFMSFPAADFWIAITAGISFITFIQGKRISHLFGIIYGSSLIFLGLYAFLYGINSGLLFIINIDEIIEICIKLYCLSVGPIVIIQSWKNLKIAERNE